MDVQDQWNLGPVGADRVGKQGLDFLADRSVRVTSLVRPIPDRGTPAWTLVSLRRVKLARRHLYEEIGKPEEAADADGGLTALGEPDAAQ